MKISVQYINHDIFTKHKLGEKVILCGMFTINRHKPYALQFEVQCSSPTPKRECPTCQCKDCVCLNLGESSR